MARLAVSRADANSASILLLMNTNKSVSLLWTRETIRITVPPRQDTHEAGAPSYHTGPVISRTRDLLHPILLGNPHRRHKCVLWPHFRGFKGWSGWSGLETWPQSSPSHACADPKTAPVDRYRTSRESNKKQLIRKPLKSPGRPRILWWPTRGNGMGASKLNPRLQVECHTHLPPTVSGDLPN